MPTAESRGTLRSFFGVSLEPQTYRTLIYNILAFPLGLAYFVVLTVGVSLTVGLGVTLAGPLVLVATILSVVSLAWADSRFTGGLLNEDISPEYPDTDELQPFLKQLFLGRLTWAGVVYLMLRFLLGLIAFTVLVFGFSLTVSLLAAPFGYGEYTMIRYGTGTVAIDTFSRSLVVAFIGLLIGFVTLHVSNLLGGVHVAAGRVLLDPQDNTE